MYRVQHNGELEGCSAGLRRGHQEGLEEPWQLSCCDQLITRPWMDQQRGDQGGGKLSLTAISAYSLDTA